jgi:hypothetical protein
MTRTRCQSTAGLGFVSKPLAAGSHRHQTVDDLAECSHRHQRVEDALYGTRLASPHHALASVATVLAQGLALFVLLPGAALAAPPGFSWQDQDGQLRLQWQGRPVLQYNAKTVAPPAGVAATYARSGYIHPLWNPAGQIVSDDFAADHFHHRGLWVAWSKTQVGGLRPNFWEFQEGTGRIVCNRVEKPTANTERASLVTHHLWQARRDDAWVTVLREQWTLTAPAPRAADQDFWQFDLTSRQECATKEPVVISKLRYGGIGYRGPELWSQQQDKVTVRTANGDDRTKANNTRTRWCTMIGPLGNDRGGLTLLDHPSNPRYPNGVRVHPTMPFFCYMVAQQAPYTIEPGKPLVERYRVLLHASEPSAKLLNEQSQDFAKSR